MPDSQVISMICPDCQEESKETARFCHNCGLPFAARQMATERGAARTQVNTAAAPTDPLLGRVLDGKYEIVALLGEGGMGAVYRARRLHIGDEAAVKVLLDKYVADEDALERFRREARAAATLRHPNVVTIHDYGEARPPQAQAYIVMELVEGVSLRTLLRREGRLPVDRAVALMRDVCAGVGAAHRQQVVHRDLKPDNVLVSPAEEDWKREGVKVVDFGIAKLRDQSVDRSLTLTGAIFGTPYYLSPEQCRGEKIDARADVYSLGAMLYEMIVGRSPFVAENLADLIAKHLTETPPPFPSELRVPPSLEVVIRRALAKDPNQRQSDAQTFAREILRAALPEEATDRATPHQPAPPSVTQSTAPGVSADDGTARTTGDRKQKSVSEIDSDAARGTKNPVVRLWWLWSGIALLMVLAAFVAAGLWGVSYIRRLPPAEPNANYQVTGTPAEPTVAKDGLLGVLTLQHAPKEVKIDWDGEWVAAVGGDDKVRLWRASDRKLFKELSGDGQPGRSLAFSRGSYNREMMIASGHEDGSIRLWRVKDGALLKTLTGHAGQVRMLGFGKDDEVMVSVGADQTIRHWRVADGALIDIASRAVPGESVIAIEDGSVDYFLLSGPNRSLKRWKFGEADLEKLNPAHEAVCGAYQSNYQASGSGDGTVRLWSYYSGAGSEVLHTLKAPGGAVHSMAFGGSSILAAGSNDGTVRVWDVYEETLIKKLDGHTAPVRTLDLSAHGRVLATGGDDKTIRLWQMPEYK